MHPFLRLTEEERRFNDYYDSPDGRRGVIERRYGYQVRLTTQEPTPGFTHRSSRRARIFQLTFSGRVDGARMKIRSATGEQFLQDAVHIPLLCGFTPRDPRSVHPQLVPAVYPVIANTPFNVYPTVGFYPYIMDPNIVLSGSQELYFDFAPMLVNDATLGTDGYNIGVIVHAWEFPGFQGGAL